MIVYYDYEYGISLRTPLTERRYPVIMVKSRKRQTVRARRTELGLAKAVYLVNKEQWEASGFQFKTRKHIRRCPCKACYYRLGSKK